MHHIRVTQISARKIIRLLNIQGRIKRYQFKFWEGVDLGTPQLLVCPGPLTVELVSDQEGLNSNQTFAEVILAHLILLRFLIQHGLWCVINSCSSRQTHILIVFNEPPLFIPFHSSHQPLFDSYVTNMPRYSSSVDSAELFYRDYAPEGRPPVLATELPQAARSLTLVLLHQWPLSSRMYDSILLPLCETHGYRVIAPDRRGFGKSEWAEHDSTAPIGYKELGQDLSGLLERIQPGPFVFVATSMSTGEALMAYLNSPYIQENCQVSYMAGQLNKANVSSMC
jgi:hypothetical protein